MAKCIDITDKLSFDKNPALIIKGRKFVVNADAGTMLEIMGLFKEGSSETEATIAAYEKLFSEKDRNEIKKNASAFQRSYDRYPDRNGTDPGRRRPGRAVTRTMI